MKILCVSDTHSFHYQLQIPPDTDMIIHAGDASNWQDTARNSVEMMEFFEWYRAVPVKYKCYVPGNHDTSIERGQFREYDFGDIILLNHQEITIEGIKLFGSPWTPSFGTGWAYNKDRNKIGKYWEEIPDDTDILVTHGPAKGIMDLSYNREGKLEFAGCTALLKRIKQVRPKYAISGHIHNMEGVNNQGTRTLADLPQTTFINASMVYDGRFDKGLIHEGIVIEI